MCSQYWTISNPYHKHYDVRRFKHLRKCNHFLKTVCIRIYSDHYITLLSKVGQIKTHDNESRARLYKMNE